MKRHPKVHTKVKKPVEQWVRVYAKVGTEPGRYVLMLGGVPEAIPAAVKWQELEAAGPYDRIHGGWADGVRDVGGEPMLMIERM